MITEIAKIDQVLHGTESAYLNIDCMDLMRVLPDKVIDLAIVDPVYGGGDARRVYDR